MFDQRIYIFNSKAKGINFLQTCTKVVVSRVAVQENVDMNKVAQFSISKNHLILPLTHKYKGKKSKKSKVSYTE